MAKVGLSFSRCIRDIFENKIDIDDVLVIIARTRVNPNKDDEWKNIWEGYTMLNPEWSDYLDKEQEFRSIATELYNQGKMHQPRLFGGYVTRLPYYWLETVLPSQELGSKPTVKAAWDRFQVVAELSNINLNKTHQ